MVNWALAMVAATVWTTAYGWYFSPDIRRAVWRRRHRRHLAELQRAEAYAAWMRRPPPPRRAAAPAAWPEERAPAYAETAPRPTAEIIVFPGPRPAPPTRG